MQLVGFVCKESRILENRETSILKEIILRKKKKTMQQNEEEHKFLDGENMLMSIVSRSGGNAEDN